MELDTKPRFRVGDKVQVVNINPLGHARVMRGKTGMITFDTGACICGPKCRRYAGQRLYGVSFAGSELWDVREPGLSGLIFGVHLGHLMLPGRDLFAGMPVDGDEPVFKDREAHAFASCSAL